MRKVPVLTAVSLLAICSLAVVPVYAGTALANDPPSISLPVGANAPDAFNINDFFVDPTGASISGGSLGANGSATVDGLSAAGTKDYSISAGSESGEAHVWASAAKFGNRPQIDNNNRLVGVPGGNLFANWGSSSSSMPLGSIGGSGTPGGGTPGGGAVAVSVGEVSLSSEGSWYKRSSGTASTGVTATIDAAGNYSINVGANARASIVSFSVPGVDAVQVLAAPATEVGAPIVGTHTVAAGANNLVIGTAPVTVGEYAQLSLTYNASAVSGVAIAVIGFDGAVAFQSATYSNPSGPALQPGANKNLATSVHSAAGSITPAVQIFNGGSAPVTVTISRFVVAQARPLVDYAINPNANVLKNPLDSVAGLIPDVLQQGASGPVAGSGVIALNGVGGVANATIQASANAGTLAAECWVQRSGAADAGSAFVLNVTDGGPTSFAQFVPGGTIPTDGFWKVQSVGTIQSAGTGLFVTMQAAGVNVNVDNLSLRVIHQAANQFDANLL